jgi:hypothetical protein
MAINMLYNKHAGHIIVKIAVIIRKVFVRKSLVGTDA